MLPSLLLLMGPLIDGSTRTSLERSGFWDEIHLPSFTYQSTKLEAGIMYKLTFHCYLESRVNVLLVKCPLHEECLYWLSS